ncbi:MAG: hypothetical protein JWN63_2670 [Candidatus Acidoferrum typicum]|nr:hypothetical protein [Candidatus Acidoferrum typicum]
MTRRTALPGSLLMPIQMKNAPGGVLRRRRTEREKDALSKAWQRAAETSPARALLRRALPERPLPP